MGGGKTGGGNLSTFYLAIEMSIVSQESLKRDLLLLSDKKKDTWKDLVIK